MDPSVDPVSRLPHRPPFRFVDSADVSERDGSVQARWRITGDEPFLAGHFPGRPVVPGVLLIEALAQAGACGLLADPRYAGRLPLLGGVEEARFRRQVLPGDTVDLAVDIERLSARGGWARGLARVQKEECCRARLLFVLAPEL